MREKAASSQIKPCHQGATGQKRVRGAPHPGARDGKGVDEQLQVGRPQGSPWPGHCMLPCPWEGKSWARGWGRLRGRSSRALPATGPLSTPPAG